MNNFRPFTALAHPNIALIKYWGDIDAELHIPANGSISMCLGELTTKTAIQFDSALTQDSLSINDTVADGAARARVAGFLDRVRKMAGITTYAHVESWNDFPMSAGIASSASAFAALSLAASRAVGLTLDERELSQLARLGSGSACRSVPGGFVEWQAGTVDDDSYAFSLAGADYWDICDCIAIVSQETKLVDSRAGHSMAGSSPLQAARVSDTPRRLELCREAILNRDFEALADIVELDSNLMHAVMLTSQPPLLYWQPATLAVIHAVQNWRKSGSPACCTIDAGPNVHVLCPAEHARDISNRLLQIDGLVRVLNSHPGGAATLI